MHCPENNLNLRIKTEPVTPGAEATKYVWHLCVHLRNLHILYSTHIIGTETNQT